MLIYQPHLTKAHNVFFGKPEFTDHFDELKSQWFAVFGLLAFWAILSLVKNGVVIHEFRKRCRGGFSRLGGASASISYGAAGASTSPEEQTGLLAATEGGILHDPTHDFKIETPLLAKVGDAKDTALNLFLMILAATLITSIPVEYSCPVKVSDPLSPPSHGGGGHGGHSLASTSTPPEGYVCSSCIANTSTEATAILTWIFFGLSLVNLVVQLIVPLRYYNIARHHTTKLVLGVLSYPVIVSIFLIAFGKWGHLKSMTAC